MAAFAAVGRGFGAAHPEPRWYRGMLHMHTHWSDGRALPEQAVAAYKNAGYDFVAISDHNRFQDDPDKWMDIGTGNEKGWPPKAVHPKAAECYRKTFGDANYRVKDGKEQLRLATCAELKKRFEVPGKFLLLPGVEITCDAKRPAGIRSIHMNDIGTGDIIERAKKTKLIESLNEHTVASAIRETRELCDELARRRGERHVFMVNHPSWFYFDVLAEDIIANSEIGFFEICNNGAEWPVEEKYGLDYARNGWYNDVLWDVVLAHRCAKGERLLYGFGCDDTHFYPGSGLENPYVFGDGYIMVRAKALDWDSLYGAICRGDFYASCGVDLEDVNFVPKSGTLSVSVPAKDGVAYKVRFIVTKKGTSTKPVRMVEVPPVKEHSDRGRSVPVYGDGVGATAKLVEGGKGEAVRASYTLAADDLYVRARVESDEKSLYKTPFKTHPHVKVAWTQPYVR